MIIADRYRIQDELGKGGMGTVYRGEDTQSGQTVAIKRLRPEISDASQIERFKREGEALRQLNHPNIVAILDTVEQTGDHYLIMEYMPGGDLYKLMRGEPLPVSQVLKLSIDIADALTRAHRLNIIHRDLKPANVLIADDGTPRLTDFGVAHLGGKERVTDTNALIGTIDYLAPEILGGEAVDPRSDIWAFGVMLFEMLGGKRPFNGPTIVSVVNSILHDPVPALEDLAPDIPDALVDLIYRMLAKDPQARMSSVRYVGAGLEDIIQGRITDVDTLIFLKDARFDTPVSDKVHRPKHNLPAQTTPFVGREAELAELARLLDDPHVRLITIVAQGGMGKTRLSLEIGERYLSEFTDGVYFVELAPLSDPVNIPAAIAEATGYPIQADGRDERQQILDYLSGKNLLLVMDNYEHLLEGAGLVTDILEAAPGVSILATSRQRLNQSGETVFNLSGMDFPEWETPDDAMEYAAVKLFIQSARRIQPGFEVTRDNMDYIARICKQVHGLPLGILLAASWLSMLRPEEIAGEIARSVDFLESDMGDLPERHRSIRAVFEYSWNLMSPDEQQVFMKLALFRGGFTREAAQAVAGASLRTLMNLMNKSLIHRNADSGRYDIHELLRQYAEQKLEGSGEKDTVMRAYTAFYAGLVDGQCEYIKGKGQIAGLNLLEADLENIQSAWHWGVETKDDEQIGRMLEGVYLCCISRSRVREGMRMFEAARSQWPATSSTDNLLAGRLLVRYPDQDADLEPLFRRGLEIARHHEDALEIAFCLQQLGRNLSHHQYKPEGLKLMEESLGIFRDLDEPFYAGWVLDDLGWGYGLAGRNDDRVKVVEESIEIRRRIGDRIGAANSLRNLSSMVWVRDGHNSPADQHLTEAAAISREVGDRASLAWSNLILGFIKLVKAEFETGEALLDEAREIAFDIQAPVLMALSTIITGFQKVLAGENQAALDLVEAGLAYDDPDNPDAALPSFMATTTALAYAAMNDHQTWTRRFAYMIHVYYDMMTGSFAYISTFFAPYALQLEAEGKFEEAARFMGAASTDNLWIEHWMPFVEARARLNEKLGTEAFKDAWQLGRSQSIHVMAQEMVDGFYDPDEWKDS